MKVYLLANTAANPTLQQRYRRIAEILSEAGATVTSNLQPTPPAEDGGTLLERLDAVVIEASDPTPEAGHLVALGIAYRKPVLYLSERSTTVDPHLRKLQANKATGAFLKVESYSRETLAGRLQGFLRQVERGEGKLNPTIKFTLRLTPAIERYLTYKTKGAHQTKADFLRALLERIIDADTEYQRLNKP